MTPDKQPHTPFAFGPFVLDVANAQLTREGAPLEIAPRPFALLGHLVANAGRLVTKNELLDAVWGHRHVSESALKVAVNTLRNHLGDDTRAPSYVETVARRGYRFVAAVESLATTPSSARAEGNLPATPSPPLGRDGDVAALHALFDAHRLVTLAGSAGVGKTRLAIYLASGRAARMRDGAWLLRLDALADGAPLIATIARTLGLSLEAGRNGEMLARALRSLDLLLVLDNCEHLISAVAPLVRDLLAQAPKLIVLTTSQEPLRIDGEQVYRLAPLAVPPPGPVRTAAEPASMQLFAARAHALDGRFTISDDNREVIADICRRLDGLPLAIELAAARVPLLGAAGVRDRLDQQLQLLTQGARDTPERHRTLRAALEWSHALLPPIEQQTLRRLSVFCGSFALDAAQAVAGGEALDAWQVLDAVGALVDKSLLVGAGDAADRLRMVDSIRALAAERLAAAGEALATRRRHAMAVRDLLVRSDEQAHDTPTFEWVERLLPDIDNLRAAVMHAVSADGDAALAVELVGRGMLFWQRAGLKHEAQRWLDLVRPLVDDAMTTQIRAGILRADAILCAYGYLGSPAAAIESLEQALQLYRESRDQIRLYFGLYLRGMLEMRVDPASDRGRYVAEMRSLEEPGWPVLRCRYRRWLEALIARDRRDPSYREFCVAELERSRAAGDRAGAWTALHGLALAEHDAGRVVEAIALLRELVGEIRAVGRVREHATVVALLASMLVASGELAEGIPTAREAVELLRPDDAAWWMALALPWIAAWQGRWDDAARLSGWADRLVKSRGQQPGLLFVRLHDMLRARLEDELEPDRRNEVLDSGAALTEDEAFTLAQVG